MGDLKKVIKKKKPLGGLMITFISVLEMAAGSGFFTFISWASDSLLVESKLENRQHRFQIPVQIREKIEAEPGKGRKGEMVCVSLSSAVSLYSPSLYKSKLSVPLSLRSSSPNAKLSFSPAAKRSSICYNPLMFTVGSEGIATAAINKKRSRGLSAVCYAMPLNARTLQWVSTISSVVLMLARGTGIQKSFIVPLFALQAPASVISWIKGEYGIWSAFLALLVRLFFFIPGELEIPFISLLLVIVAPYQVQNLRGTQEGSIISLLIAAYLAFQHFSRAGSFRRAFDQNSIVATVAVICVTAVSFLLVI